MTDEKSLAVVQLTADELEAVNNNRQFAEAMTVDLEDIDPEWAQELEVDGRMALLFRMRTSIDPRFTLTDQANIFGKSVATIKRWAGSDEYRLLATELASPSRDEIILAARAMMEEELLPLSLGKLKDLLADPATKGGTALAAIKLVLDRTVGTASPDTEDGHRRDAMEFLKERGVVNNTQIIINNAPPELSDKLADAIPADYDEVVAE
jgi:hypothetical protein